MENKQKRVQEAKTENETYQNAILGFQDQIVQSSQYWYCQDFGFALSSSLLLFALLLNSLVFLPLEFGLVLVHILPKDQNFNEVFVE